MLAARMSLMPMRRNSQSILSTVAANQSRVNRVQNKQFVKVVIWIVVVSMTIGLGFTVFALMT